jgi:hypothetical protein
MMSKQTDGEAPSPSLSMKPDEPTEPQRAPSITDDTSPHAPAWLRYLRLLSSAALLAVALGGIALEFALVTNLRDNLGRVMPLSLHMVLVVLLDALAGAWLLAVVLGCLVAGAMSLTLVFSRRGW